MTEESRNKRIPTPPTQERSKERFEIILDCAETLLKKTKPEDLSLYDVAREAGLTAASVYRFFPSVTAIIYGLAQRYLRHLYKLTTEIDATTAKTWQQGLKSTLDRCKNYYNQHPHAMDLIFGAGAPREIRSLDRSIIQEQAKEIALLLSLSQGKKDLTVFVPHAEITLGIVDSVWSQSYHYHGKITDNYQSECYRAAIGYLEQYIPKNEPSTLKLR